MAEALELEGKLANAEAMLDTNDLAVKQDIAKVKAALKTVQEQCKLVKEDQSPTLKQLEDYLGSLGRLDKIDLGSVRHSVDDLLKQAKKLNLT